MKSVISVNSIKRKNNDIDRICDPSYHITHVDKEQEDEPYLWKDKLRYQILESNSIIETNNNLGLLTISSKEISNTIRTKL